MVKRSKKSKSKRTPLRKKYKIIKKVKEHHKKQAKEAKKQAKLGHKGRSKVEKDPGIPNAWPFKEQELAALEARRARALEEIELKKAAKKERAAKRKLGLLDDEDDVELAQKAAESEKSKKQKILSPQERFYTELMKVIEASDVIIQVLDARDPLGSRCVELERMVHKAGPHKRVILLLNKIDLVPREIVEQWLKYFREELPTVAFKCNSQHKKNAGRKSRKVVENADLLQSSNCLGAETLLQLLRNYSKNQKMKTAITVGVVGFPNVGKSSVINSLKRTQAVSVQATPCITKVMQEIELDKHVKLLDCPGILVSTSADNEASATLRNFINVHELADAIAPVREIVRHCPAEKLMSVYKITKFSDADGFLTNFATVRGKARNGVLDNTAAARTVLQDWNEGKIPYFTVPPALEASKPAESSIVSDWATEFDVEKVFKKEQSSVIAELQPLMETEHVQIPCSSSLTIDFDSMMNGSMEEDSSDDEEQGDDDDENSESEDGDGNHMNGDSSKMDKTAKENLAPKARKLKVKHENANGKKKSALAKSKAASKVNSKASDDYDFNTDYTDDMHAESDSESEEETMED